MHAVIKELKVQGWVQSLAREGGRYLEQGVWGEQPEAIGILYYLGLNLYSTL